jgi:hypothetical protein
MGLARKENAPWSQNAACFSEVPVRLISRLTQRRSSYGLGFTQALLSERGGCRVWYVDLKSVNGIYLDHLMTRHRELADPHDPFWRLTPFIDRPGDYAGIPYRFEWEREWRVQEGFRFNAADVGFVFAPGVDHATLRGWLSSEQFGRDRQSITAPLIDPTWPDDQILATFQQRMS